MRTWLRRASDASGGGLLLRGGEQPGAQDPHRLLLVLQLGLLVLAGHHDAGGQVGDPHRGVGGVDALAAGPGRAEDVDPQVVLVDLDLDVSSASGMTSTPAAEVWMRPCDSVTGTRCTRCTPPSNFSRAHGAWSGLGARLAFTATA